MDKIQLRDLSKYKTSSPEERGRNARDENALGDGQPANANPPLPPRGQTPQPYPHRPSLAQFQPKSVYALPSDSPGRRQSPFHRAAADQDTASAAGGGARYRSSGYASPPPHQTEPIHSRNTSAYDDSPSHLQPQQRHHPPPSRQQQQPSSGADSNAPYARLNSRSSVLDETAQQPPSKMANHVAKGANWFTTDASSSYSSHSPPANSISGQRGGDGLNGYRASADFGSPPSQTPSHSTYPGDRSAYADRIDVLDPNESSYQRNVALRRNSKPVSGDSPHSYKQVSTRFLCHAYSIIA